MNAQMSQSANFDSPLDFWVNPGLVIFFAIIVGALVLRVLSRWPVVLVIIKQTVWVLVSALALAAGFVYILISLGSGDAVQTFFGAALVIGALVSIVKWVNVTESLWFKPEPVEPYEPKPLLRTIPRSEILSDQATFLQDRGGAPNGVNHIRIDER